MLQQLRLENFKGLKKAKIDFGRVTVLIGPNGTGKSSISQALLLLRQSLTKNELTVDGPIINLGSFDYILNENSQDSTIGIGLTVSIEEHPTLGITEKASYSYDAYFDPRVRSFEGKVGSPSKKYFEVTSKKKESYQQLVSVAGGNFKILSQPQQNIAQPIELVKMSHSGDVDVTALTEEIDALSSSIYRVLFNTHYVPAIRGLDQPSYQLLAKPSPYILSGQNKELSSTFQYSPKNIKSLVSKWSEVITGSKLSPEVVPDAKVVIESYATQTKGIPICVDGFGANQLVQLLLTIARMPEQALIAIEEPEIHLHPKAQKKLCDILVECAKSQNKQMILSTHSERVLYGFISAVKDNRLERNDLSIYWFEEKGAKPRKLEIDDYGDVDAWGKNFFSHT